jgi:hypothetical protein
MILICHFRKAAMEKGGGGNYLPSSHRKEGEKGEKGSGTSIHIP